MVRRCSGVADYLIYSLYVQGDCFVVSLLAMTLHLIDPGAFQSECYLYALSLRAERSNPIQPFNGPTYITGSIKTFRISGTDRAQSVVPLSRYSIRLFFIAYIVSSAFFFMPIFSRIRVRYVLTVLSEINISFEISVTDFPFANINITWNSLPESFS